MSNSLNDLDSSYSQSLIAELQQLGVKHNPDQILRITKLANGRIIFLEEGKPGPRGSGFQHILERHQADFGNRGITPDEIPDLLIAAVSQGKIVGYQGTQSPRRPIYEVLFQDTIHYVAVSLGNNGYIVGANPANHP